MSGWKGHKVRVSVRKRLAFGSREIHSETTFLDTDTLLDLYEKFPPDEHSYHVYPDQEDPFQ